MVKKLQKMSAGSKKKSAFSSDGNGPLAQAVKDSAQQIWLAGLGAFAKAQEEGGKMFDSLVKDGLSVQRKTQSAAEDKLSEASEKMVNMASGIQSKAGHQWDKLETIFEERVAKALAKLGVPTQRDLDVLTARIDAMSTTSAQRAAATRRANTAARKTGAAAPAKAVTSPSATSNSNSSSSNTAPAKKARRSPVRKAASSVNAAPAPAPAAAPSSASATSAISTASAAKKAAQARRPTAKRSAPVAKTAAPAAAKTAESSSPSAS